MMNGDPNLSGMRQPPQPFQQLNVSRFHQEVPDISLVFNPDEHSLVLPLLSQQQQSLLHRSRSVPGRISEPALPPPQQPPRYCTPPPQPAQVSSAAPRPSPAVSAARQSPSSSVPARPSPLIRAAPAALSGASASNTDSLEVVRPAKMTGVRETPPAAPAAAVSARSAGSPISSSGGEGLAGSVPPEPACCGAELRAVLRLVADNGRQLAQLRAQVRQLLSQAPATEATPTTQRVLVREVQTQTEIELVPRPVTAAAAVNTSFSLTPRRDVGTDPPPPSQTPPAAVAVGRHDSEMTGSGGRENTAQVQCRRVQEWVAEVGWPQEEQEQEPELTLRGLVLPTVPEQQPSPEASLHVEMQEYQPSLAGSAAGSVIGETELERPKPDRTFFQNVMGQVNQILDGVGRSEPVRPAAETNDRSSVPAAGSPVPQRPREDEVIETESDPVRRATLQQLRAAGVSIGPCQPDDGSVLDYSCVPRAVRTAAAVPCSTDLSLEMNTLAMKYVDNRQLLQRAAAVGGRPAPHPVEARLLGKENLAPPARGRPTDMTMYGISDSNMSFSTRKYMEKFNLQS